MILPSDGNSGKFLSCYKNDLTPTKVFPVGNPETLEALDNKWLFNKRLMETRLSTPWTRLLQTREDVSEKHRREIIEEIGFPLVVKPLNGESGQGVKVIQTFTQLIDHVKGDTPYSELPLIIQPYIPGIDIGMSYFAENGKILALAVQRWEDSDTMEFCRHEEVEDLGKKIIQQFNYTGVGHIDMRIHQDHGTVYALECNPRFWYTLTAAMWQGLNFVEVGINHVLGNTIANEEARGHYTLPGKQFRILLRQPWKFFSLTPSQKKGVIQPLLDPITHIFK